MSEPGFYPIPIEVESLDRRSPNFRSLGEGVEVTVIYSGDEVKIVRNECPHMGAPLNEGILNQKENTLTCPWHGYVFDLKSCNLKCNPSDAGLVKVNHTYKSYKPENTPKYRLRPLACEIRDGKIFVKKGASA